MSKDLYCDLTVFSDDERQRHQEVYTALSQQRIAVQEIDGGYVFQFAPESLMLVAEFVNSERLCCPFFHFRLELNPSENHLSLQITSEEGAKEILQGAFGGVHPSYG